MKQDLKAPLSKNQDVELTIDGLTGEGAGVGRAEGYAVFVPGALPGERVSAHVIKVTPSYGVAKVTEVLSPSKERVTPRCPAFGPCGGCTLQHLSYPAQLQGKKQQVIDALARLGGFTDPPVEDVLGMEDPWRYRNKGSFPIGLAAGGAAFGFFAPRSHRLVAFDDCPIQDERCVDAARRVCAWANEHRVSVYNEESHTGSLRHVVVRATAAGEVMAVVVTNGPLRKADALIAAMEGIDSLWHNENSRDTNVIFGPKFTLLSGKPALTEIIGEHRFSVSPQSFLQVNAAQTAVLYGAAVDLLSPRPEETVADLYCGIGTISLLLSEKCRRVIGVEQVSEAVEDARSNALLNGVTNASFLCGAAEALLPNLLAGSEGLDALVLDPPRKGCEPAVLAAIADAKLPRLVYVSCNPATLARDLAYLAERGYRLLRVQPVDMFPQTSHGECAALVERAER